MSDPRFVALSVWIDAGNGEVADSAEAMTSLGDFQRIAATSGFQFKATGSQFRDESDRVYVEIELSAPGGALRP